ncbi:MAG: hypothetical protein QOF29_1291 [bacterium]|jgi:hypothetical protein
MRIESPLWRVVLRLVVGSLLVAGVVASVALLSGDFGDVEGKIIASSALLALVSATAGAGLTVRRRHAALGIGTVALSLVAFALTLGALWLELDSELYWRVTACCAIGALESAHASVVLSLRRATDPARVVTTTRVVVGAAVVSSVMSLAPVAGLVPGEAVEEGYVRILGVVLVVQLVGTAVAPLLRRLAAGAERPAGAPPSPADRLAEEIDAVADRLEALAPAPGVLAECARLRRLARTARSG